MNERERRKRDLAKARRLLAKVRAARLAKPGKTADPRSGRLLRALVKGKAVRMTVRSSTRLEAEIELLERRLRSNASARSVEEAADRLTRRLGGGRAGKRPGGRGTTLAAGDPTTDYGMVDPGSFGSGDSTTDYGRGPDRP